MCSYQFSLPEPSSGLPRTAVPSRLTCRSDLAFSSAFSLGSSHRWGFYFVLTAICKMSDPMIHSTAFSA